MERTTRKNVDGAAHTLANVAALHGIDTSGWAVRYGSQTYGRAWLLIQRDPHTGGERTLAYLGWSAREAHQTLAGMVKTFDLLPVAAL